MAVVVVVVVVAVVVRSFMIIPIISNY